MNPNNMNILVLAYLGDSVYEHYIRTYLIHQNIANVNDLQTASLRYVSAKSQAKIVQELINRNQLTEEEQALMYNLAGEKRFIAGLGMPRIIIIPKTVIL